MMDLTPIFKASIMAVKMRKKNSLKQPDKNRILQAKSKDEFSKQAKEVCKNITALRDLLIENRAAYMKFATHLKSSAQMTDEERDLIDRESEKIFNYYTAYLAQLKSEWRRGKAKNRQHLEHIEFVIDLLSDYLKAVHNFHLSQKKYRMQYELDTYKFVKLASDKKQIPKKPGKKINGLKKLESFESVENGDDIETKEINEFETNRKELNLTTSENKNDKENKNFTSPKKVALEEAMNESTYDDTVSELSPEDVQMYESENIQLYNELQGLAEEVEQIEKNVVDIARLQEIFTEKVVLQKHDIERIANAVVGATENVKDANEQIKQAIQRNASLRVWTLFFLLVISFTLLFLDWYND